MTTQIAFDHQIFSEQAYGGVSRYFFEVARRIQTFDGFDVSILSPLYVNNYLKRDPSLKVWGTRVNQLPRPRRIVQQLNAELVRWKMHRERPDIVHETYYLGRRLASPHSKIVVTVYDMIHEKFPQFFPSNDQTKRIKKASVERADHVICISENTRTDLIDILGVAREKTTVTHLAHTASDRNTAAMKRVTERPYVAYVGVRTGYKNFSGLLQAFRLSKTLRDNFSIVCFGGGAITSGEHEELRKADLKPEHMMHINGDDALLDSLYRGAAAFVYPSLYEGFGLPPLESMSAGCPVVCSRTSSLPEVCGDAAEYFDPAQPESIAAAMEHVLASNGRKQELIALGRLRIQKFSWDTCARQTATVYEAL